MSEEGSVNTINTISQPFAKSSFSHLFPAHLYLNKPPGEKNAGEEIDHCEDVADTGKQDLKPLQLFNHESKVHIGTDTTSSSYQRMPVDNFGKEMLTKLGWQGDGHGIGRNKEKATQIIEYIPRQHRLGLGAKALTLDQLKKQGGVEDRRKLAVT